MGTSQEAVDALRYRRFKVVAAAMDQGVAAAIRSLPPYDDTRALLRVMLAVSSEVLAQDLEVDMQDALQSFTAQTIALREGYLREAAEVTKS